MSAEDVKERYAKTDWGKFLLRHGYEPYDTESVARTMAGLGADDINERDAILVSVKKLCEELQNCGMPTSFSAHGKQLLERIAALSLPLNAVKGEVEA